MPAQFKTLPRQGIHLLFDTEHFHTWVHNVLPGSPSGPMHKHTAEEQIYCVQGEGVYHFDDGTSGSISPGVLVTIPAGQLYRLDLVGDQPMILIGARAEASAKPRALKP